MDIFDLLKSNMPLKKKKKKPNDSKACLVSNTSCSKKTILHVLEKNYLKVSLILRTGVNNFANLMYISPHL